MNREHPFYKSSSWLKNRVLVLVRDQYLCQPCFRKNKITIADEVHHIQPMEERPDLALELDNLESICSACLSQSLPKKSRTGIKLVVVPKVVKTAEG